MRLWLLCTPLLVWTGCGTPQRTATYAGTRSVVNADARAVFDAAEIALIRAGFDIDRRSFDEGVLTTKPIEANRRGEPTGGVQISSRVPLRRIAEVRIRMGGGQVEAGCKVLVQEQTTRTHRLITGQQAANDTMSDTPIDRDAATTSSQYTVWRTLRRDREMERAIMDAITERSGP